ncbi:hypothetical protein AOQ84DRAFT_419065 [Glonium stellatum]|uniref:Uncharacterized protein n=1 Tax=Glonium stellatum TaxID=574774 RepID=A0A8E2ERF7_9PEZI|nr:hypothetical protein AOQ84DRAFT_419065 [Glonium stellatum]
MFHLGRAFLQAAFVAQNWQTDKTWLAQAPGPSLPATNIKTIAAGDDTLIGMPSPPSWEDTWKGVLVPLTSSPTAESASGLSTGAKVGIGVGVAVGALVVLMGAGLWLWRRRRGAGAYADRVRVATTEKDRTLLEMDASGQVTEMAAVETGSGAEQSKHMGAEEWEGDIALNREPVELPGEAAHAR